MNKNEFEDAPIYVECLGIGNFMKAVKSRFQYYFLKTLLIPLLKTEFPEKKILLNVYDPVLNKKCIT